MSKATLHSGARKRSSDQAEEAPPILQSPNKRHRLAAPDGMQNEAAGTRTSAPQGRTPAAAAFQPATKLQKGTVAVGARADGQLRAAASSSAPAHEKHSGLRVRPDAHSHSVLNMIFKAKSCTGQRCEQRNLQSRRLIPAWVLQMKNPVYPSVLFSERVSGLRFLRLPRIRCQAKTHFHHSLRLSIFVWKFEGALMQGDGCISATESMFSGMWLLCREQYGSESQPWVTVGVLAEKSKPTASKTGSMFSRWKVSDLDGARCHYTTSPTASAR